MHRALQKLQAQRMNGTKKLETKRYEVVELCGSYSIFNHSIIQMLKLESSYCHNPATTQLAMQLLTDNL